MAPLRILILSDGRPGHFNLAEGIAAAIERIRPAVVARHDVRRGRWPGAVLAGLTRSRLPARAMLRRVYGLEEQSLPPCDVIVSAGAETLAASVWAARARRSPNVFYGSLRLYDPCDFALVLTSYARNAGRPRHALALKPSRLDPETIGARSSLQADAKPTLALLIGGDAGPMRYGGADWDRLLGLIGALARERGVRWLIANSRRTPAEIGDRLAGLAAEPSTGIAQFLDVRTAGPGTLPALLAACDAVLCTADSSSMISECIWARRPTLALAPETSVFTPDERTYRDWLVSSGWCRELPLAEATPAAVLAGLGRVTPPSRNPQAELADVLAERLPGLLRG